MGWNNDTVFEEKEYDMKTTFVVMMILAFLLAACSGGENAASSANSESSIATTSTSLPSVPTEVTPPTIENAPVTEEVAQVAPTVIEPTVEQAPQVAAVERPAWQTIPLTNARTGETFTLADFAGKTVFVEPIATWCTNCRAQLQDVRSVRDQIGTDNFVFIALSLETQLTDSDLADYADRQGFDWTFAVMSEELLQELTGTFGRALASAPSTPHFIIRPDGSFTQLKTGQESASQIAAELTAESGA